MTKDEELKEAIGWWRQWEKDNEVNSVYDPKGVDEMLVAYHHHRLETDVDGFDLSQITAKQSLDAARKSCQENKLPETPKETGK